MSHPAAAAAPTSPRPRAAAPRDLSWLPDPATVRGWAQEAGEVMVERTGTLPVADAVKALDDAREFLRPTPERDRVAAGALARAQVCLDDVLTLVILERLPAYPLGTLVHAVSARLFGLAKTYPDMPVADAVGWMLLVRSPAVPARSGYVLVEHWAAVDLAHRGWLYAGAGFSPEEARAGLDAGTLTEKDARALAALRGLPLPG